MTRSSKLHPCRHVDVRSAAVGADAALYDARTERVHRLNTTAALVWQLCDGTSSLNEISGDLVEVFDQPIERIGTAVTEIVSELAAAGLLEGTTVPGPRFEPAPESTYAADQPDPPGREPLRRLSSYRALDLRLSIECHDSVDVADEIERSLEPLRAADANGLTTDDTSIVVWSDGEGGWNLETDGARLNAQDESVVCDYVLWQITRLAIERSSRYLVVHASAVARDGAAVILPAQANSGKSTLATILVEAGFDYLTDEAVAIDLDSGEVVAYPKPITLDPGTQQLLPHLNPGGLAGSSSKWRIAPTEIRPGSVAERAALAHVVLPTYEAGADNTLEPIEPIDAVVGVLSSAFNLAEHADRLDDVVAVVERCTRHSLRHDGIDGPRTAIQSLF